MIVGVCRVVLSLPHNRSLKGKRSVVRKVVERARSRFHVAAAEVADLDVHQRATLGFSVVSNDATHARSVIDKVLQLAATSTEAQVVDEQVDVYQHDFPEAGYVGLPPEDAWNPPEWDDEED